MPHIAVDKRRQLLVEAAIRVMARDGVAKATTRAIAAEAGMALAAFHYSFRSKQELLEHVFEAITAHTVDQAMQALWVTGTVEEKVRGAIDTYWRHLIANPAEHRLTYELTQHAARHPALAPITKRQYEAYIAATVKLVEALAQSSNVRFRAPVPVLARYVLLVIDGLTLLWLNEGDTEAARAALDLAGDHMVSLIVQVPE
jgi:AcrR family transcriptional regulator